LSYRKDGYLKRTEIVLPTSRRRKETPYVVIECIERIPCDPCVAACPKDAIKIDGGIVEIPRVDYELCNGCLSCIALCPGLAIFVIDETFSATEGLVSIPYEFLPRPKKGEEVIALNRKGEVAGRAIVHRVIDTKKYNRCAIVTLRVRKELGGDVRFFKRKENCLSM